MGTIVLATSGSNPDPDGKAIRNSRVPVYNLPPLPGYPAQFGFQVVNINTVLSVILLPRTESYGLTIGSKNVPKVKVVYFGATFCSYGAEGPPAASNCKSPAGTTDAPFLSNPLDCSDSQPTWKLAADSWENASTYLPSGFPDLSNPGWKTASVIAPPVTGCDNPLLAAQFNATTLATKPLQPGGGPVRADSPTGLAVDLDFPQANDPTDLNTDIDNTLPQTPEPKDITVTLPAGSASTRPRQTASAPALIKAPPGRRPGPLRRHQAVRCPDSAKIGSAVATSPLLALYDPQEYNKIIGPQRSPEMSTSSSPTPATCRLVAATRPASSAS